MATPNYLYAIAINTLFIALRYEQIGLQMADGVCATGGGGRVAVEPWVGGYTPSSGLLE